VPEPDFFLNVNKNIKKTTYHREFTKETINRFKLGYVGKRAPQKRKASLSSLDNAKEKPEILFLL
jgi:hypothetical protein